MGRLAEHRYGKPNASRSEILRAAELAKPTKFYRPRCRQRYDTVVASGALRSRAASGSVSPSRAPLFAITPFSSSTSRDRVGRRSRKAGLPKRWIA